MRTRPDLAGGPKRRAATLLALAACLLAVAAPAAAARALRTADAPPPAPKPAPLDFTPAIKATKKEVAEIASLFDQWNAALATLDPEKVADMYADDAVLLPTVSNQVRPNRASRVAYFADFLKAKPQGSIDESYVRFLNEGKDVAANSGLYTFDMVKDGKPAKVAARYTYIYRKVDGEWKIAEHHSSVLPEPVVAPAPAPSE